MKTTNQYPKSFKTAARDAFPKEKKLHRLIEAGEKNQVGIIINEGLRPTYVFTAEEIQRAWKSEKKYKALIEKVKLYHLRKKLLSRWVKITKNWK